MKHALNRDKPLDKLSYVGLIRINVSRFLGDKRADVEL